MKNEHSHVTDADLLWLIQENKAFVKGYEGRIRLRPSHENTPKWKRFLEGLRKAEASLNAEAQKRNAETGVNSRTI